MSFTTNPKDPRLGHNKDESPAPQEQVYLILTEEERKKGFERPYRDSYQHVGDVPIYELRDLTDEEKERYKGMNYVKFEIYPESMLPRTGRFWTQEDLGRHGCGAVTKMARELAETYARNHLFYGATYCAGCKMHRPVREFIWTEDGERVGS